MKYLAFAGDVIELPNGRNYRVTLDWKEGVKGTTWRFVEIKPVEMKASARKVTRNPRFRFAPVILYGKARKPELLRGLAFAEKSDAVKHAQSVIDLRLTSKHDVEYWKRFHAK